LIMVHAFATCESGRAVLELKNGNSERTAVREITAAYPSGVGGSGAWIRELGALPIELDPGEPKRLDITGALRAQYFNSSTNEGQTYAARIEINSTPPQKYQGGVYRFEFNVSGEVIAFEGVTG
jgi:hypothetical protein